MRKVLPLSLAILVIATFPFLVTTVFAQGINLEDAKQVLPLQETLPQVNRSDKLNELRTSREAKQAERQAAIEAKRAQLKAQHERGQASFQARLASIKDERKATLLQNLNNRYPVINQRWTTHFNNILNRLEEVLAKIASHGVDTSLAQASINSARVVVDNQSLKTYVVAITDENNLKKDAQAMHQQLRSDLKIAGVAVNSAREAVKTARAMVKQTQEQPATSGEPINDTIK